MVWPTRLSDLTSVDFLLFFRNLSSAEAHLGELSAGLLDVDATVAKLKQQLSDYTKEAAEIEIGLRKANETLASAEGLVSKLTDEFDRWREQVSTTFCDCMPQIHVCRCFSRRSYRNRWRSYRQPVF